MAALAWLAHSPEHETALHLESTSHDQWTGPTSLSHLIRLLSPWLIRTRGWTSNSTVAKLVVTYDGGVNVLLYPALTGCTRNSG
jgi:hypothetical protein